MPGILPTPSRKNNPCYEWVDLRGLVAGLQRYNPHAMDPETPPPPEKVISSGDIIASIVGGIVYLVVAGSGILNVLAALRLWNPLRWEGRLWTGVFMIAAPTALIIMATLPYRVRQKIPDGAVEFSILALWIAFFWAACGGH